VLKLGSTITKIVLSKNYLWHHIESWKPAIELLKNSSISVSHFTVKMTQIISASCSNESMRRVKLEKLIALRFVLYAEVIQFLLIHIFGHTMSKLMHF